MSIYDIKVKKTNQEEVSLSKYKGKLFLIVNTATGCGFTPQYEGLEELYRKYKDRGLEVLDFPCNQFLNQAPGTDEELSAFCQLHYNTTFETFAKVEVNGANQHPLYKFLKDNSKVEEMDDNLLSFQERIKKHFITWIGNDIKWNFTKFLVDQNGKVIGRFAPTMKPAELAEVIEKYLA